MVAWPWFNKGNYGNKDMMTIMLLEIMIMDKDYNGDNRIDSNIDDDKSNDKIMIRRWNGIMVMINFINVFVFYFSGKQPESWRVYWIVREGGRDREEWENETITLWENKNRVREIRI